MKLSIIIPVYNVELYLRKCLDCCFMQNFSPSNYEVIVVNDGSPDNSMSIICEYKKKYSNIVVVDKENGGLSSARNAGMRIARGEYIWFVDSDDWIREDCLSQLELIMQSNPDIITLNTILHTEKEVTSIIRNLSPSRYYSGKEVYSKSWIYPFSAVQFYVFRRNFLIENKLSFINGIFFEDLIFTSESLSVAKVCAIFPDPVYYYRIRENSITTSGISEKKIHDMFVVMDSQYMWIRGNGYCDKSIMSDVICKTANSIIRSYILKLPKRNRKKWNEELTKRHYWIDCVIKSMSIKNLAYYFGFKLNLFKMLC